MDHPCLACGACCASYRVAFHWLEAESAPGGHVPEPLTERLDPHRLVMRGTQAREPRCVALEGTVGARTRCSIYAQRPSPCRELVAAWEHGEPSPQCDRARARHGMPPLTPDTWSAHTPAPTAAVGHAVLPRPGASQRAG